MFRYNICKRETIKLIFVNNKKVIDKKYYNFGVVDITNKFDTLKNDVPSCSFSDVYNYVNQLIDDINIKAEVLILAGEITYIGIIMQDIT